MRAGLSVVLWFALAVLAERESRACGCLCGPGVPEPDIAFVRCAAGQCVTNFELRAYGCCRDGPRRLVPGGGEGPLRTLESGVADGLFAVVPAYSSSAIPESARITRLRWWSAYLLGGISAFRIYVFGLILAGLFAFFVARRASRRARAARLDAFARRVAADRTFAALGMCSDDPSIISSAAVLVRNKGDLLPVAALCPPDEARAIAMGVFRVPEGRVARLVEAISRPLEGPGANAVAIVACEELERFGSAAVLPALAALAQRCPELERPAKRAAKDIARRTPELTGGLSHVDADGAMGGLSTADARGTLEYAIPEHRPAEQQSLSESSDTGSGRRDDLETEPTRVGEDGGGFDATTQPPFEDPPQRFGEEITSSSSRPESASRRPPGRPRSRR